jgi:hypothetical protein
VLQGIFAALIQRMAPVFAAGANEDLIEPAIGAFMDFLTERPKVARILLRELADHEEGEPSLIVDQVRPITGSVRALLEAAQADGIADPVDPVHLLLTVSGASLFFVTGAPILGAAGADHKAELVRIVRRLLGLESD